MSVARPKAAEKHHAFVRFAVAGRIAHVQQFAPVADVRAAMAERKPGGHIESIGVGENFIRLRVAVGVFENEQLVIRLRARFELGIRPRAQHPQPPARVPPHANGIGDAHRFIGEQVDLQLLVHRKRSQFGFH